MSQTLIPPESSIFTYLDRPGDPAAGAALALTLRDGYYYSLHSLRFRLVTAVAVANRFPLITFDSVYGEAIAIPATNSQPASNTWDWCFIRGGAAGTTNIAAAPRIIASLGSGGKVMYGATLNLSVLNIQAADQLSAIRITFEVSPAQIGF